MLFSGRFWIVCFCGLGILYFFKDFFRFCSFGFVMLPIGRAGATKAFNTGPPSPGILPNLY